MTILKAFLTWSFFIDLDYNCSYYCSWSSSNYSVY